jgi:hypothetical protein
MVMVNKKYGAGCVFMEIRMIIQTRRMASCALGIVRMVRDETGQTTARNLQQEHRDDYG